MNLHVLYNGSIVCVLRFNLAIANYTLIKNNVVHFS